jgi:thioredoxin-dependent peroxiredoxin
MLKVGSKAPEFNLPDKAGQLHSLSEFKGGRVLLYFYPKDDTAGCTAEACGIRDNLPDFKKLECQVVGVSADSPESHGKFEEKYKLNFLLLSDESKKVLKKYGVWQEKRMYGRVYMGIVRTSFLIDGSGKILKIYTHVKPAEHAEEVIKDLKSL